MNAERTLILCSPSKYDLFLFYAQFTSQDGSLYLNNQNRTLPEQFKSQGRDEKPLVEGCYKVTGQNCLNF